MTYSYTQISQYLSCPRRYKHRYLDGWKEKDTRAAMMFGRAFEQALGAYFQRQDAAVALYKEWSSHGESGLHYSERDSWDRMLQSGVQLLDRFAQDDRVRIRQPRRNLQVKFTKPLAGQNDFVALRRCHRRARRHSLPAGVEDHRQPVPGGTSRIARSRSAAGLLFLGHRYRGRRPGGVCPQTAGRDSVLPDNYQRRTARGIRPPGPGLDPPDRSGRVPASQWYPLSPEPLHQLSLYRAVSGTAGSDRSSAGAAPRSRRPWLA